MILVKEPSSYGFPRDVTKRDRYCRRSRALLLGLLLCVLYIGERCSFAQNSKPTPVSPQILKAAAPTDFKVPLLAEALRLSDFPEMEPKPELRDQLVKVSSFIQNAPNDGEAATQQTDVWVARTKSTIYFVFI